MRVLESLPFDAREFDLLLACDVIEHVRRRLARTRGVAQGRGHRASLIITAPAYQWLWTEHDVQLHHFRRYTLTALTAKVRAAGWNLVFSTYFNSILLPAVAAARVASRVTSGRGSRSGHTDLDRTPALLNGVLEQPMRFEAAVVRHGARLPAGVSLGLVCRRDRISR